MIVKAYCRCGCGTQTAIREVAPDMAHQARLYGLITGHKELIETIDTNKEMLASFIVDQAKKGLSI